MEEIGQTRGESHYHVMALKRPPTSKWKTDLCRYSCRYLGSYTWVGDQLEHLVVKQGSNEPIPGADNGESEAR